MATNWNAVLANINNASDILAILRKVLGLLDGKVDLTRIDEIIADIESMQLNVDTALASVNTALSDFDAESQEAIQQVIAAGLMEGFATEAELLATRPIVLKKYAKAEDTDVIWFWNKPEGSPDGNYWTSTGLSGYNRAVAYANSNPNFKAGSIGSGVNLNTFTTSGDFYKVGSGDITAALNYPVNLAGKLRVDTTTSGLTIQEYVVSSTAETYKRFLQSGVWSAWKQSETTTSVQAKIDTAINSVVTTVFSKTGKNKFNKAEIVAGEQYSPSSQKIITSSAYRRSGFVPIIAGKTYTLSGNLPGAVQIAWFAAADKLSTAISNSTSKTATAPAGANFAVFNITNTGATDTTYDNTTQLEEGSQATAYEAYKTLIDKNVVDGLAETLVESDVIEKVSFNMINPSKVDFVKRYSTGTLNFVTDNLGIAASDWIPVQEGEWYAISGEYFGNTATPQGGYFAAYGSQNALQNISWTKPVDNVGHAFKVPAGLGITHVVVSLKKKDSLPASTTLHGNVQLEKGEMTTPYQAYDPKKQIKASLIPSGSGGGGGGSTTIINDAAWLKYVKADGVKLYPDKLPNFRKHILLKDKDIVVLNTGTSLTARTSEHCTLREDAAFRPPMMHSHAFCSHVWDALMWAGQQYRRYDSSYFTETGTFATAFNLAEWDDGPFRDALTRYSVSEAATLQFVIPINAWQFNFIYRTDSLGCDAKIVIAEGDSKVQVFNETTQTWVEANNFVFSMFESVPVKRDVTIPNPMGTTSVVQVSSKANTTYQKRLKMRCRDNVSLDSLSSVKNVSISRVGGGSRFMYWGVEWSPRQFMITYINSARGSHATNATAALSRGLPLYQDNEIWGFKPDLILSELGIHNDGAAAAGSYPVGQYAGLAYNYVTNTDYELSMFSRAAHFGLNPEYAFFTASIAWNFRGIEEDGSLKFGMQTASVKGPPRMMSALDKYQEATDFLRANNVICIDAAKRWVDAGFAIFGDLKTATLGSGKDGTTFTNEGSHWNDTGSAVMAKAVISLLG